MTEDQPNVYDERLSCKTMPSLSGEDGEEIEIDDADGNKFIVRAPASELKILSMPRISEKYPDEVNQIFEAGIGLGLVACKVIERDNHGLSKVQIPTLPSPTVVTVATERIARRV